MSIAKVWSGYSKEHVKQQTNNLGVYEIAHYSTWAKTGGEVLYIGEGQLKTRLIAHLPNNSRPEETVVGGDVYRYEETGSKIAAKHRQNAMLREHAKKFGKLPKYNQHRHSKVR